MAPAGIGQFPGVGFNLSDKHCSEAVEVWIGFHHGIDGRQRFGRRQADREAIGKQVPHMLGLHRLFRPMPGNVADDYGDIARICIDRKRPMKISARRRLRWHMCSRDGILFGDSGFFSVMTLW